MTSPVRQIWALRLAGDQWRSPDHFISSSTDDPKQAKPFYGENGRFYANLFQRLNPGSEVVPHPHPEIWK